MRKTVPIVRRFVLSLFIASLVGCTTSCFCSAPGKGRKARSGFRAAAPLILALEKFRETRGQYPATLEELVPTYLPDATALLVRGKVEPLHSPRAASSAGSDASSSLDQFLYGRDTDGYRLSFSYTGPGMNTCVFDSRTKQWNSQGYY